MALFDTLITSLLSCWTRHETTDVERLATRILENDGNTQLLIGVIRRITVELTFNRITEFDHANAN